MKIDRALNLVLPVDTERHGTVYVHSTPISREVFERYFLVISKTFSSIYKEGLDHGILSGPRIAAMMLKQVALDTPTRDGNSWDGPGGVENGLMNEIRRLTNVVLPAEGRGWETLPFHTVVSRHMLSDEDVAEIEGAIVFFICNSAMHRRATLRKFLESMASILDARITSSTLSDLISSLPTSNEIERFGETAHISSVPS